MSKVLEHLKSSTHALTTESHADEISSSLARLSLDVARPSLCKARYDDCLLDGTRQRRRRFSRRGGGGGAGRDGDGSHDRPTVAPNLTGVRRGSSTPSPLRPSRSRPAFGGFQRNRYAFARNRRAAPGTRFGDRRLTGGSVGEEMPR